MSFDYLNSTIRQRTGVTVSSDDTLQLPGTSVSGLPMRRESILEGTRSRGSQIGRNVIEGLQLDKLGERMSKLEMPDLKLAPNMHVDEQ
jgi:hypothetical protein